MLFKFWVLFAKVFVQSVCDFTFWIFQVQFSKIQGMFVVCFSEYHLLFEPLNTKILIKNGQFY